MLGDSHPSSVVCYQLGTWYLIMQLIDSHCHLDFEQFDIDRENILSHCQQLGITNIIVPAVMANDWSKLITVCQSSAMLFPALGLHPMFMAEHKPEHIKLLEELISIHQPIAIGEIGLDFYLPDHDRPAQIQLFSEQLHIAQKAGLAVILHVRKAHDQVISLLKRITVKGGIVHAFSGSMHQAKQYQQLGFLFGIGGVITHPKATRLRTLMSDLPLTNLVLETDAPDMPLVGMHGQRNTPENIPTILNSLAKIRLESRERIATVTTDNCKRLFPDLN